MQETETELPPVQQESIRSEAEESQLLQTTTDKPKQCMCMFSICACASFACVILWQLLGLFVSHSTLHPPLIPPLLPPLRPPLRPPLIPLFEPPPLRPPLIPPFEPPPLHPPPSPLMPLPPQFPRIYTQSLCTYFTDCHVLQTNYSVMLYGHEYNVDLASVELLRTNYLTSYLIHDRIVDAMVRPVAMNELYYHHSRCVEPDNVVWVRRPIVAVPSYSWIEITHCNTRMDGDFFWFYVARGSGRWIFIESTILFRDHSLESYTYLRQGLVHSVQFVSRREGFHTLTLHEIALRRYPMDIIMCGVPGQLHTCLHPTEDCPCSRSRPASGGIIPRG